MKLPKPMPTMHAHNNHHNPHQARATPTRSNLGPLTTTFTPPSRCTGAFINFPTGRSAYLGQSCYSSNPSSHGAADDTACWPRATQYPRAPPLAGLGFYSPGLICPTGYTSACSAASWGPRDDSSTTMASNGPMDGSFQFPLISGETAVGCCPTGFSCAPYTLYGWQTCHSIASSTLMHPIVCDRGTSQVIQDLTVPYRVVVTSTTVTVSTMDVWAPLIQINWQKTDRYTNDESWTASSTTTVPISSSQEILASAAAVPSSTSTLLSGSSSSISSTSSPSPTPATSSSDISLTLGAKAGITVSSTILFICLLSIFVYLYARKRYLQTPTRFDPTTKKSASTPSPNPDESQSPSSYTHPHFHNPSTSSGKIHSVSAFSAPFQDLTNPAKPTSRHPNFVAHSLPGLTSRPTTIYELGPGDGRDRIVSSQDGMITFDAEAIRFGRGLGIEDDLESPIDGTSPFRLKRGNTVRGEASGSGRMSRASGLWTTLGGWREREGA